MRGARKALVVALVSCGALASAVGVAGQERPRVAARVRQVAGATLYLDLGTRHGLATGDTLDVAREGSDVLVGRLVVTAGTEARSVLGFAGALFPVTRGEVLTLHLLRAPAEAPPAPGGRPAPVAPRTSAKVREPLPVPRQPAAASRRAHGRIGLELSGTRSVTRVGRTDPLDVDRTFATPALRLDVTVPEAAGGFRMRTSMRLAYRYSDTDVVRPAGSTRVYAAALERDFTAAPVRLALGRFQSPVESYSGFWDGAFVRWGGAVGVGALVGFEPDRWDERPSTALPKATAFLDATRRGGGWRWSGDLSVHAARPADDRPDHTFIGFTERLSARAVRLGHDVQLDRDPAGGSWRVSRLRVNGSVALGGGVWLRSAFARRESWLPWRLDHPFAPRNTRLEGGLSWQGGDAFASVDVARAEDLAGRTSTGATGSFSVRAVPLLGGADLSGVVARWSGTYGTTLSAGPALAREVGDARLRVGYRHDRSDSFGRRLVTHAIDASFDAPLGALRATGRARVQWGAVLAAQSFQLGLARIF